MAELANQLMIKARDKVGRLAEITDAVKDAGINILAVCAWVEGDVGKMLMLTDNNSQAAALIESVADSCESQQVVTAKVANRAGALNELASKLAEAQIGIEIIYAAPGDADQALIVLSTTDNEKAAGLI